METTKEGQFGLFGTKKGSTFFSKKINFIIFPFSKKFCDHQFKKISKNFGPQNRNIFLIFYKITLFFDVFMF